jgi:branched-chain amino acid transport system substrate-binding protein
MAEYAVDILHADSAAIITSTGTEHLEMVRAFANRFQQLGGTIVAIEYYRSRDKDFGPYIRDVKAILLGRHPDSIFFVDEKGDTLDADGIPARIDCLFLPGSPDQIRLLLPQIRFYNLNGSYLGSDGWGDEAVLKLGDNTTREAVFPSPFLSGVGSDEYVFFSAAYDARFGRQPNRLAALGYDAVRLVTRALRSGGGSKEMLIEQLKKVQNYDGSSGKITFGENRENIEMPLFRILSEQAVPLLSSADSVIHEEDQ